MGANGSAVDHLDAAIVSGGNSVHHPVPDARLSPSHETVVAGGARAIAFGKVAPRSAGSKHPEDTVQHAAIINAGHASRFIGQQRFDHAPLEVGQVISAHAEPESQIGSKVSLLLDQLYGALPERENGHARNVRAALRSRPLGNRTYTTTNLRQTGPTIALYAHAPLHHWSVQLGSSARQLSASVVKGPPIYEFTT